MRGERIIVQGQVQGVGFRPTVWRIATELGLTGDVRNTGQGVEIRLFGRELDRFAERLVQEAPALARLDAIERAPLDGASPERFAIAPSDDGALRVCVTPDTATCPECLAEIRDPFARRYRYPFANCTNCGPRFSIIDGRPYDRAKTTMRAFAICEECRSEYEAPADRRFHAQPIACHVCGPRASIERLGPGAVHHEAFSMLDDVDAAGAMIMNGHIVAVKGIGGFHLACDATNEAAVLRLRAGKRRRSKAFALMARDIGVVRRYCEVSGQEEALLQSAAAPIVILRTRGEKLPDGVAPGLDRLGFMLPYTPLHHLVLRRMTRPVVMTSGNISGQPQCIDNDDARRRLTGVADFALMHDRDIANRIDDSVVRVDLDQPSMLRRARGYAPSAIPLPCGFDKNLQALALGAELKNAFCLVKNGEAILSQHMGDLEDAATDAEVAHNLDLYRELYDHAPQIVAVDAHPDYRSTARGRALADAAGAALVETQHHHAHVAACMAENGVPLKGAAALGVALDGTGFGPDGTIWGGEFLACTYTGAERLGCFKPVALPGGAQAIREPWRNAYAHLMAQMGWAEFAMNFDGLDLFAKMSALPRPTLDAMIAKGVNTPLSSSCGRLFDAAAAMCGLAWDRQDHEAQAAMAFEAAIDASALNEPEDLAYPFSIPRLGGQGMPYIEPLAAWRALLGDLLLATPVGVIAARFHRGLARAVVAMVDKLSGERRRFSQVALTGGCFQNATLFALVHRALEARGFEVLSHRKTPSNDGGLALGQVVIALAQHQARGD
jgi:hydrogenase maturation protein HypF